MRIISGRAKGRKLLAPDGYDTTRPTLDRVKESMFSIIQLRILGSKVLDVFAGTGSLGLEAASRGAKECILVDRSPDTYKYLHENIKNLKLDDVCRSLNMDSYQALEKLGKEKMVFDIIFIDPPYLKNMIPRAVEIIENLGLLNKEGIIVSKIDSKEELYNGTENIILSDYRKYGNTTICFYKYKEM
ncbi:MAG: 16S rRNA (guanine(966)-N(2))-methyltransferase RsmD [Solirubrobacterales bacterium]